jgi:hypothetical protein
VDSRKESSLIRESYKLNLEMGRVREGDLVIETREGMYWVWETRERAQVSFSFFQCYLRYFFFF